MFKMKRVVVWVALVIFTLVIFLPPIVHGYVYPNNGDDAAFHLQRIEAIGNGEPVYTAYWGDAIVGYPILWLNGITGASIDSLYMWFNFIVLWLVGVSVYVLLSSVISWQAGLLAIPLVVFWTPSTLNLFDFGGVFDLATVGVVLPLLLYCVLKVAKQGKLTMAVVPMAMLAVLLVGLHSMAILLAWSRDWSEPAVPVVEFVSVLFGFVSMILLLVLAFIWFIMRKSIRMDAQEKMLLGILAIVAIALAPFTFYHITSFSVRFGIDLAIVLAMLTACLLGVVLKTNEAKSWAIAMAVVVVVLGLPLVTAYAGYNSAIRPADKDAITYVNSLDYANYNCSPEIAPWIYDRFVEAGYSENANGLLITRDTPMTERSNPESGWYDGHGIRPDVNCVLDRVFDDGSVKVKIYRRGGV